MCVKYTYRRVRCGTKVGQKEERLQIGQILIWDFLGSVSVLRTNLKKSPICRMVFFVRFLPTIGQNLKSQTKDGLLLNTYGLDRENARIHMDWIERMREYIWIG